MARLIVFDVEGVILPRKRALILEIASFLGWFKTLKILFYGSLYQLRLLPLNKFIRNSYRFFKGLHIETFLDLYRSLPILKNSENVFKKLRSLGYTTVLMSSGLPQVILEDLKNRICADQTFGLKVDHDNFGVLSGEICGDVIEDKGKLKILQRIMQEIGVTKDSVIVVADDWNNLQMFNECNLFIGFNPEVEVAAKTEYIVRENDLQALMELLLGQPMRAHAREVLTRKGLHLMGAFILMISAFFGLFKTQLLITLMIILYILSEYLRLSGRGLPLFTSITRSASSEVEQMNVVATPIWFALGVLISMTLFPFRFAVVGILTLTVGDPVASLVGRTIKPRHLYPYNKSKSIEGTLAGYFTALLVSTFFSDPLISVIGCLVGMLVESLPLPINDNMTVPILSSLACLMSEMLIF